jgi:hypothetical protein
MAERNGSSRRTGRLKTAEGLMEYAAPQIPIALAGLRAMLGVLASDRIGRFALQRLLHNQHRVASLTSWSFGKAVQRRPSINAMASLIRNQPSARELRSDASRVPIETDYAMLYVHQPSGRESRYVVTFLRSPRGIRGVDLIAHSEAVLQRSGRSPIWPVD